MDIEQSSQGLHFHSGLLKHGVPVDQTLATYRAGRENASSSELLAAVVTDWYFRMPAIRLTEAYAQQGRGATYMYEFAWQSPAFDGHLGACYAPDVPFIFDNFDKARYEGLAGSDPPQQAADAMHAAWVAFATSGKPGWPQYNLNQRATMRFATPSRLVDDPRSEERLLWEIRGTPALGQGLPRGCSGNHSALQAPLRLCPLARAAQPAWCIAQSG